ncbi:MAG TPA: rhodanese-like domain-containing protein [Ktedonobacteraceae bacterium]|nr:rhodanese-like domain-containing protein [Ktedonobacteraceae bacterium]
MNNAPMKPRILALLSFARQQEQQLVDGLSEAERNAMGTPDAWAAKDFLVNIMRWKQLQTEKLAAAVRGETPPAWRDMQLVHQINNEAFTRYQAYSFQNVLAESERIFNAFIAQVESMSEEELTDAQLYDWQEGEPLWEETLGNGLWHPCSQMTAFYLQRGDRQAALHLQEALLMAARQAELPPEELAVCIYNQACFYATNGWPDKALLLLPEAVRLRPTLIEWSKHDSDLDSLRSDSAFEAIYQDSSLAAKAPVSSLISPRALYASSNTERPPIIIDVRGASEFAAGHVQGARNIPLGQLARKLQQLPADQPIVTYCNMHHPGESRGERAAALLREHGYQAQTIDGGYPAWKEAGLPVEEPLQA